ncbi:uncharacterized protein HGUI_01426 [Hanseniaspora guilliermondii]|uniref:BZIP domain-containing protein n=1 Tax=Hanseniaspora guilliermondii TaxID=56406 RepID=A0A1L0AYL1_9ASCO|nr:uncharacterized protein HGUI_01426 [Hanseniaspora guilliermondii]
MTNRNGSNNGNLNQMKPLNHLQFRQLSNNTNERNNSYLNFYQNLNPPHKFNNFNVIGDDSDLANSLKPLYRNYNIDVSQWPLTNPPIFENFINPYDDSETNYSQQINMNQLQQKGQTVDEAHMANMYHAEKDKRRRRVSISNGQIDQLNNDILQVDQLYYSQPPVYPKLLINQVPNIPEMGKMVKVEHMEERIPSNNGLQSQNSEYSSQQDDVSSNDNNDSNNKNNNVHVPNNKKGGAKRILPPSNTLIPGTPEYKKARLLERNRIAAMKCRQRKKLERDLMARDYDRVMAENKELKKKIQELEKLLEDKKIV